MALIFTGDSHVHLSIIQSLPHWDTGSLTVFAVYVCVYMCVHVCIRVCACVCVHVCAGTGMLVSMSACSTYVHGTIIHYCLSIYPLPFF